MMSCVNVHTISMFLQDTFTLFALFVLVVEISTTCSHVQVNCDFEAYFTETYSLSPTPLSRGGGHAGE